MQTQTAARSIVDTKGKRIAQVGIVVRDAPATARRYAELLGIGPWTFLDLIPAGGVFKGRPLAAGETCIRIGLANLGKLQLELIQPLYGPSTHRDFLDAHGEGVHHVSFGRIDDHDQALSALEGAGIQIEMQGDMGGGGAFTYMVTQDRLGTIFEMVRRGSAAIPTWGSLDPPWHPVVNPAGRRIAQVGIVVRDAEKTAQRYWELLGIGPWTLLDFKPPHVVGNLFHGIPVKGEGAHTRAALANYGELQFELLQPVSGSGTHMDFLKTRGEGVHHLSFGTTPDHDQVVAAVERHGIGVEMSGLIGGAITFTYLDTQSRLGTILEVVKRDPEAEITLKPYGTIPA